MITGGSEECHCHTNDVAKCRLKSNGKEDLQACTAVRRLDLSLYCKSCTSSAVKCEQDHTRTGNLIAIQNISDLILSL